MASLLEDWVSTAEASGLASLRVPVLRFRSRDGDETRVEENDKGHGMQEGQESGRGVRLYEWHELRESLFCFGSLSGSLGIANVA
jgi:hypothetical protein